MLGTRRRSMPCWLVGALASSLIGCAAPSQQPLSARPADSLEGHEVRGAEFEAHNDVNAKERAACAAAMRASPPSQELVSVDLRLDAKIPSFSQPIAVCVLVDGERLLTDNGAVDAARYLAAGEQVTLHVGVTPGVRHHVVLRTDFDGPEQYRGFHFALRSRKAILAAPTEGSRTVWMHLFERPDLRLERRPTHEWSVSGPITLDAD